MYEDLGLLVLRVTMGGVILAHGLGAWSLDGVLNLTYPDWLVPAWIGLMLAGDIALLAIRASRKGPAAP